MESTSSSRPGRKMPPICRTSHAKTRMLTERRLQQRRRVTDWMADTVTKCLWKTRASISGGLMERSVSVERLPRGLLQQNFVVAEQAIDCVALFKRHEEQLAVAGAPYLQQVLVGEKDVRSVREIRAKEHGGGAA